MYLNTRAKILNHPAVHKLMMIGAIFASAILATGPVLAGPGNENVEILVATDSPAARNSAEPHLARGPDGTVVLSWLEKEGSKSEEGKGETVTLKFSVLMDDQWGPARTVASGDNWFVNWADFPSVVPISSELWAAHWLVKRPGGTYAYDVAVSLSRDGGVNWGQPITPHDDNTMTEHGFVSLFPWHQGVGVLWLDGRNMTAEGHEPAEHGGQGGMTLRAAAIRSDQSIAAGYLVDELVCDCCQTDVAAGPEGPIAVYRNRTSEEIRDIHVSRAIDDRWQPPRAVADDGWEIAGCPVNGPAIATAGRHVGVAWFTMADDFPRVRYASSADGAASFSDPVDIDEDQPVGRVDVVALANGSAVVSWLHGGDNLQGEIAVRYISAKGVAGPVKAIAPSSTARPAGFPQMVSDGEHLVFAWTDSSGDAPSVRTARMAIVALQSGTEKE
jgi:hypothetical protein